MTLKVASKEFWKKEIKSISIGDLLRITAMLLILLSAWYYREPIKNPCDYCALTIDGEMTTCRQEFDKIIETKLAIWKDDNKNAMTGGIDISEINFSNFSFQIRGINESFDQISS